MKVALGYCYRQMSPTAFIKSTIDVWSAIPEVREGGLIEEAYRHDIDKARNNLVTKFLATRADALLSVDTDIIYTPEHVQKLIDWDLPFVSGAYMNEFSLIDAAVLGDNGHPKQIGLPGGPTEVLFTGAGFTLIQREVFEKIAHEWYSFTEEDGWKHGEDWSFCVRVRQAGYKIMLDPEIRVGHLKYLVLTPNQKMVVADNG